MIIKVLVLKDLRLIKNIYISKHKLDNVVSKVKKIGGKATNCWFGIRQSLECEE